MEKYGSIRNIQDLEKLADILVSTVITLREHNRGSELEPGSLLFCIVVEKIPKTMLSRYFRPAFESHGLESLQTLRDWMVEESEYQVKATERTEGLGAKGRQREDDRRKSHAFTTLREIGHPQFQRRCDFCEETRQDKRATAVEGNPKAPFSLASTVTYGINRNSRQGGGGATPLPLRAQLVPSNTGTHFTYHEWMESRVNF